MTYVRSDDPARRLEFTAGFMGYEARIPILVLGGLLTPFCVAVMIVVTAPLSDVPGLSVFGTLFLRAVVVAVVGIGGSLWVTRWVGRWVTPTTSVRYLLQVLRNEIVATRPEQARTLVYDLDALVWVEEKDREDEQVVEYILPDFLTTTTPAAPTTVTTTPTV